MTPDEGVSLGSRPAWLGCAADDAEARVRRSVVDVGARPTASDHRPLTTLRWGYGTTAERQRRNAEPSPVRQDSTGEEGHEDRLAPEGRGYGRLSEDRKAPLGAVTPPVIASLLSGGPTCGEGFVEIREERQASPVGDPVSALTAVTRPIISGVLHSIGLEYLDSYEGDRTAVPLKMVGKLRTQGDGDVGIAFEYAIHDAILTGDSVVTERVSEALKKCRIREGDPASILFAIEKQGSKQLISTELDLITNESRVLSGKRGQPVKLRKYLNQLAAAFRRPTTRPNLPQSINGLWKADLFLGSPEPDRWVGTSVKINPTDLRAAAGLRIAIIPTRAGRADAIRFDEAKNLVVCPIPHDESFMQIFYSGVRVVQALCSTNFKMPREVVLESPIEREVARIYVERRERPTSEVLDAVGLFAQPHLLETVTENVGTTSIGVPVTPGTGTVVGPFPMQTELFPRNP
jgi:hypothetical protein